MKNLKIDQFMVEDCILTLENESAFYTFFFNPIQKMLKKKIDKNIYKQEKAINFLQEKIREYFKSCSNMEICKYQYKYIPTVYDLSKEERIEVARGLIENFELDNI